MARWTELKDFRDDCRSVQATGAALSKACVEALGKELEPPPYAPIHFYRLAKRGFNATDAMEFVHLKASEIWGGSKVCMDALLRGSSAALLRIGSSEDTNDVPRMAFQNWRWIASAIELFGQFRDITLGRVRLLITSASQWTGHQAAEVPQYMVTLATVFASWLRTLPVVSQNINLRELSSFLLHPWTFDSALLLLSTAEPFRYRKITGYQRALFITVLLVYHLILWPIWCNDCYSTLWRIINRTSDAIFFASILPQRKHVNHEEHLAKEPHNFVTNYAHLGSIAMNLIGIELGYEITFLLDRFLRYQAIFGILFTAVVFLAILLLGNYSISRGRTSPNGFFALFVVLLIHATELHFIIHYRGRVIFWEVLLFLLLYSSIFLMYRGLRQSSRAFRLAAGYGFI